MDFEGHTVYYYRRSTSAIPFLMPHWTWSYPAIGYGQTFRATPSWAIVESLEYIQPAVTAYRRSFDRLDDFLILQFPTRPHSSPCIMSSFTSEYLGWGAFRPFETLLFPAFKNLVRLWWSVVTNGIQLDTTLSTSSDNPMAVCTYSSWVSNGTKQGRKWGIRSGPPLQSMLDFTVSSWRRINLD